MRVLLKIIPVLIFWGIFIYVVLKVPYPESLTQAHPFQLLAFFTPLYFTISFTLNLLLKNLVVSLVISMGVILLFILKALDSLNFASGGLAILSILLLVSYFNPSGSARSGLKSLTSSSYIPKLRSLRRRNHG